ncbi:uncharacterized protein B0J16DRAFT_261059 [Fusarium flagelliforme]|uniref:Methyl-CpG-binding domain-containing protein 4 n=1 Tax=Fusarium flagelliforme TaxID=2675880 RepID=A0A395MH02_9HYPO|nr:uncharacterized protein B0J16DRAFT_261059 [Fusarium flagelliforme]KAH7196889.1 hypothetical protein B0J16DRAFT_261059 [Fusarium flagelliforme]RFN47050.1 hypothetical protein FIE12Z_8713 [Fusarium flagelliforme]
MSRFGHDILSVFNVAPSNQDFLADVIESGHTPADDLEDIFQESLLAGAQDWKYLVECATSMQRVRRYDKYSTEAQDLLAYVWRALEGRVLPSHSSSESGSESPWEMTDRLIAQAKELEGDPEVHQPQIPGQIDNQQLLQQPGLDASSNKRNLIKTSPYWSDQPQEKLPNESRKWSASRALMLEPSQTYTSALAQTNSTFQASSLSSLAVEQGSPQDVTMRDKDKTTRSVKPNSAISPFFTYASAPGSAAQKRPPSGTVPSIPFAPLTSSSFGLIQEDLAHEPFWLLVAVSFLIKTKGVHAIPTFYKVKERFPTPADVASAQNSDAIIAMIRHLGLAHHRVTLVQNIARGFLDDPPAAEKLYKVKNYDCRDVELTPRSAELNGYAPFSKRGGDGDLEAWEIGHLTQGKYAIDSWRIFCRDELLGRAEDWKGKGRKPEFQPEWMRVHPNDKELRAYLRWMWMKEGWEWDPTTGKRVVLREEMRNAVNEGRVEYDNTGGLRVVDKSTEYPVDPSLAQS